MEYPREVQNYLSALDHFLKLADLSDEEKKEIRERKVNQIESLIQSQTSGRKEETKRMIAKLGDPEKEVSQHLPPQRKIPPTLYSLKRRLPFFPLTFFLAFSFLDNDFVTILLGKVTDKMDILFYLVLIGASYVATLFAIYDYRFDKRLYRDVMIIILSGYVIFWVQVLFAVSFGSLTWEVWTIPLLLVILLIVPTKWMKKKYATFH
ncbi:hypothetical protein GXN76_04175 [Kroppenstedtia pulmonis]|uniref:Uncharacterized protein n=1 Tax=Kroppenstedtia pulmonis TaxID=1380685 RepID=A0A7D4BP50_9BACL|nr:hypothetical protein [Kroppenstedtia pulmonis]QKG83751.1 hypothetical protein GXN76_04175 [Kroppenstedtia pulmonis]